MGDYDMKLEILPQLLDTWQIINSTMLMDKKHDTHALLLEENYDICGIFRSAV